MIPCRGCKGNFDADACSTDTAFCPLCKKLLDRIGRVAAKNGSEEVDILKKARTDPKRIQCVLKSFKEKVGYTDVKKTKKASLISAHACTFSFVHVCGL